MKNYRRKRGHGGLYVLLAIIVIASAYAAWCLQRPLPPIQPHQAERTITRQATGSNYTWPASGQAAVGVVGFSTTETNKQQKPVPIASTAKVITSLVVLDKYPLSTGQKGPTATMTAADVELYRTELTQDGSNLPIAVGDKLTEYQMIQALMLPSANNIANSMANWAYGSQSAYAEAANKYLLKNGITNTKVGLDASGLSPTTTSTAEDLVKIGKLAMQNPALSEIVGQSRATGLGQAAEVRNVNNLLGTSSIVGIKTGNSTEAGGAFISASRVTVNNKPVTIITAVLGAPDRPSALRSSLSLVQTAQRNFTPTSLINKGDVVGSYQLPWGGQVTVSARQALSAQTWNGSSTDVAVNLNQLDASMKPTKAGLATLKASPFTESRAVPLYLNGQISEPSVWWRLRHPF